MLPDGPVSSRIRERLRAAGIPFFANDCIADHIEQGELMLLRLEVEERLRQVFESLVIDVDNDHNTKETAKRVARMYINEVFKGRYHPAPNVTSFPNAKHLDELYTVGPITVRSACSHHLVPIIGKAWIGVMPTDEVIGLSKFNRLTEWVMARPQIQEEAAIQLADEIEARIKPRGLGVVIRASHLCMTWRGVRDTESEMVTSVMRGTFREDKAVRSEFLSIIKGQGY